MEIDHVIDFKDYGLDAETVNISEDKHKTVGKHIVSVIKKYGYCYLKNHGVDEALLDDYRKVSRAFFKKPVELKEKLPLGRDCKFGWLRMEGEVLTPEWTTGDFKETFNYTPESGREIWLPVEDFELLTKKFFDAGRALAFRLLDILALGLDISPEFMREAHKLVGRKGNTSQVRTLYYPPIPKDATLQPDQARLSEHVDYGTFSFNFQDSAGGLEIRNPEGIFVPVDPIPNTVVVAVGVLLQRWTSDYLMGSEHRILIPTDEAQKKRIRQALIFFLLPDDDFVIKCLDGSNKYEPMRAISYAEDKFTTQYLEL